MLAAEMSHFGRCSQAAFWRWDDTKPITNHDVQELLSDRDSGGNGEAFEACSQVNEHVDGLPNFKIYTG
jgi:hypothetical protein